jgi:hypothetical protein
MLALRYAGPVAVAVEHGLDIRRDVKTPCGVCYRLAASGVKLDRSKLIKLAKL